MKRAPRPPIEPIEPDPGVRITFAELDDPEAEAAIDRWLRSLLNPVPTPDEGRRS